MRGTRSLMSGHQGLRLLGHGGPCLGGGLETAPGEQVCLQTLCSDPPCTPQPGGLRAACSTFMSQL